MGLKDRIKDLKEKNSQNIESNIIASKNTDSFSPDEMITLSSTQYNKLKTENATIGLLINISIDLDDALISKQLQYRRENGKKISKESLIIQILKQNLLV